MRWMLETRPDMSTIRNSAGFTPLHLAVDQGMVDMAKLLLNAEADISLLSKMGDTPLHRAAKNGNLEVVQVLLDSITSPETKTSIINIRNKDGNSPTMFAARSFHRPIVPSSTSSYPTAQTQPSIKNKEEPFSTPPEN